MADIAWIEDDHERIGALVRLLEIDGHKILRFRSLEEVRENINKIKKCDAIILDLILPPVEEDPYLGVTLLDELYNEHGFRAPVVVCSLVQNPVVIHRLQELGVTRILTKPVRPSVLYDAVTAALESIE